MATITSSESIYSYLRRVIVQKVSWKMLNPFQYKFPNSCPSIILTGASSWEVRFMYRYETVVGTFKAYLLNESFRQDEVIETQGNSQQREELFEVTTPKKSYFAKANVFQSCFVAAEKLRRGFHRKTE